MLPQQTELAQTKGGFFPPVPALDIHILCFLQVLSALSPALQPKPFCCAFTEFDQTPLVTHSKATPVCALCITDLVCLWLSKDHSNKTVLFCSVPISRALRSCLGRRVVVEGLRGGSVAHSNLSWNAEARDAVLGLNLWALEWTMNCVFIFCWHVVP